MKVRPLPHLAFDFDLAAHLLHQLRRNDQTESGTTITPAGRFLRLGKRLKQLTLNLGGNADSAIFDLEAHQHVVGGVFHPNNAEQHLARRGELDRIGQKIVDNLAQPVWITYQAERNTGIEIKRKLEPFAAEDRCESVDD